MRAPIQEGDRFFPGVVERESYPALYVTSIRGNKLAYTANWPSVDFKIFPEETRTGDTFEFLTMLSNGNYEREDICWHLPDELDDSSMKARTTRVPVFSRKRKKNATLMEVL